MNEAAHDLEIGAPPRPEHPTAAPADGGILGAHGCPLYARGLAFCKLLKFWTACRTTVLCGLNPSSLRLNRSRMVGLLEKTKTTGAGKQIRHLPIYICHSAYFMAPLIGSAWAGRLARS